MKKQPGLVFTCLCLAIQVAWAQAPTPDSAALSVPVLTQKEAQNAPVSQLDGALFYQLLLGEINAQEGEPAAGFALLLDAARKTGDAQLYQRATDIALQSRSGDSALQAANAWKAALPVSRDANRYVLQILIALNRIAETQGPLRAEIRMAPDADRTAVLTAIPRAYSRASDKALASTVVEAALADSLKNPATTGAAWTTVGRMRLAAGDNAGALEAVQRGRAADMTAQGPVLLALELMEAKIPEAEGIVKAYLEDPVGKAEAPPEIHMVYAQTLLGMLRYAEAMAELQIITREKPDFPQSWLVLGSLQLQDNQLAQSQVSLERYVALTSRSVPQTEQSTTLNRRSLDQAYLALAQLAEKRKDYAGAEAWLGKIENSSALAQAQARRAFILASQGKFDEGRKLILLLPEGTPEEARLKINAEIGFLREFKQYQAAHDLLARELAKAPDDLDLLYDQSMVAEKLGSLDEMERLLRRIIALKPDYHHAYNALGYALADRGLRLTEARELIRKALEFAPSDPFIKDSLGWVEFRLGNNAEAIRIFESAYKAKPDAEIAAHFGEVLWSMGQRDRALMVWREAQALNPNSEALNETLKRLQVKM